MNHDLQLYTIRGELVVCQLAAILSVSDWLICKPVKQIFLCCCYLTILTACQIFPALYNELGDVPKIVPFLGALGPI